MTSPQRGPNDDAARTGRVDQLTGEAREIAAMAAAFYLEAVRCGVSLSEANSLTSSYIAAEINRRWMRQHLDDKDHKPPWAS